MAEEYSVSDIVNSIKLEYPIFKDIEVSDKRNKGMSDSRQLEYYHPEDSPTGKELVEIFNPNLKGEELKNAIFGDMLHSAPSKSKEYADKKLQLINSRTPEQIEIDKEAYNIAIKQGEKRPFDKWFKISRSDAFIRGYLANQWEDTYYTEEQKELMNSMVQSLRNKSGMNKGGTVMKDQMEMAFMSEGGSFPDLTGDGIVTKKDILRGRGIDGFEEGGLRDEGGTVDPVSGNDVPSGSNKSEVRDDIPAMLSEGEFVFPADVVRYIGLSKLMELRQEAKMGLKVMEEMGQMGNSEEATLPDDFGIPDIEIIEDDDEELDGMDDDDDENDMDNMTESGRMMVMEKRAQGGVIEAQQGTVVPNQFEQMMGYGAGQGSNPYGARRIPYTKADGSTVNILEDYMGRPMESIEGLTRSTPYQAGPIMGGNTPAGGGGVTPIQPVLPPMPVDPTDDTVARRDRDAFYGKGSDSTGRLTSMAEAKKQGKKLGDFSDAYEAQQARLDNPTRTGNLLEDLKLAGKDLITKPKLMKEDLINQLKAIPEEFKKSPDVLKAIGEEFNMAKRLGVDRIKGGYKKEQKERKDRKDKFKKASEGGSKVTVEPSGDSAADKRRQKEVDKKDKEVKDRLKEASKTGSLRLKKGGLMKKDYP